MLYHHSIMGSDNRVHGKVGRDFKLCPKGVDTSSLHHRIDKTFLISLACIEKKTKKTKKNKSFGEAYLTCIGVHNSTTGTAAGQ